MPTPWKIALFTRSSVHVVDATQAGWQSIGLPAAEDVQVLHLYYQELWSADPWFLPGVWAQRHVRDELVYRDYYWWHDGTKQLMGANRVADIPQTIGAVTLWALAPATPTPGALKV